MKKFLALTLSLLMVLTFIPVATVISSAAEENTYLLHNFDGVGFHSDLKFNNTSQGKAEVVDYTTIDPDYTDGKVISLTPSATGNPGGFKIDQSWKDPMPSAIKFQIWTTADTCNLVVGRTGIATGIANASVNAYTLGATDNSNVSSSFGISNTPTWMTYDLTKANWTNDNMYLIFCENGTVPMYIDNVTLVYENASDVPAAISEWKTMYDWETDTAGASVVGSTKFTRNTAAAFTSIGSTYGLKVVGTYSKNASYMKVEMKEEAKDAVAIRVPMLYAVAGANNPTYIGVVVGGVNYWCKYIYNQTTMQWKYFNHVKYTADDNTTLFLTRDKIKDVEALLFSFGNSYSNFYVDDIQYALPEANETTQYSVKVDGTEIAKVDEGATYALPESTVDGFVAYTDGENYMDVNTEITVNADVELSTVAIGKLEMQQGASIRLGEVSGIRFRTVVDADKLAALPETAVVEKGTYIGPKDLVDFDNIKPYGEADDYNCIDVKYAADNYHNGSTNLIAGSIVEIQNKNIARDYVGRGYVKVTLGDITKTILATENDNTKSVAYIANAYKSDASSDYSSLDDALKAKVDEWAAAYVG